MRREDTLRHFLPGCTRVSTVLSRTNMAVSFQTQSYGDLRLAITTHCKVFILGIIKPAMRVKHKNPSPLVMQQWTQKISIDKDEYVCRSILVYCFILHITQVTQLPGVQDNRFITETYFFTCIFWRYMYMSHV